MSVNINITSVDNEWETKEVEHRQRKTVQYKSDGMLFKEDWEAVIYEREYRIIAHADDDHIQEHVNIAATGFIYSYWPWHWSIYNLDDEIILEWEIDFKSDGTADASISTQELSEDWEVKKKHRPVPLRKEPS